MDDQQQYFARQYASMADDELIDIALSKQLTTIAQECLDAELQKRGLKDLSLHRELRDQEHRELEGRNEGKLATAASGRRWGLRLGYAVSALFALRGFYLLAYPLSTDPPNQGPLFILLAVFMVLVAIAIAKLARWWHAKVLYRPWWR